jgi:hypothetical protein
MIWEFRGYSLAQSVESGFSWVSRKVFGCGSLYELRVAVQQYNFCVLFSFYLPINPRHRTLSDVRQLRRCTVHIVLVLWLSVHVVSMVSSPSVSDFAAVAASSA